MAERRAAIVIARVSAVEVEESYGPTAPLPQASVRYDPSGFADLGRYACLSACSGPPAYPAWGDFPLTNSGFSLYEWLPSLPIMEVRGRIAEALEWHRGSQVS